MYSVAILTKNSLQLKNQTQDLTAFIIKYNFFERGASGCIRFQKEFFLLISNLKSEVKKNLRVFLFLYFFCLIKIRPCYPDTKLIIINPLFNNQLDVLFLCIIIDMNIKKHLKQLNDMFALLS